MCCVLCARYDVLCSAMVCVFIFSFIFILLANSLYHLCMYSTAIITVFNTVIIIVINTNERDFLCIFQPTEKEREREAEWQEKKPQRKSHSTRALSDFTYMMCVRVCLFHLSHLIHWLAETTIELSFKNIFALNCGFFLLFSLFFLFFYVALIEINGRIFHIWTKKNVPKLRLWCTLSLSIWFRVTRYKIQIFIYYETFHCTIHTARRFQCVDTSSSSFSSFPPFFSFSLPCCNKIPNVCLENSDWMYAKDISVVSMSVRKKAQQLLCIRFDVCDGDGNRDGENAFESRSVLRNNHTWTEGRQSTWILTPIFLSLVYVTRKQSLEYIEGRSFNLWLCTAQNVYRLYMHENDVRAGIHKKMNRYMVSVL